MSTLLKDRYSPQFYAEFCEIAQVTIPKFNDDRFKKDLFNSKWNSMELKERVRHTSNVLHQFLPSDFKEGGKYILKLLEEIRNQEITDRGLEYFFLPDYVETYGFDEPDFAMDIMEDLTSLSTCEFAIRPFIISNPKKIMKRMLRWSKHSDFHIRRLSSEGSRPRLPWAMAISAFKKDPSPTLPILENLKNDESEFVRRSVANHLNDISKDHPELALDIATKWHGQSAETDWVVKHASRTLLKQGIPRAMQLFGFGSVDKIEISELTIDTPIVKVGSDFHFHFELSNKSSKDILIRLEYGLYYQKANGTLSKKVFAISEKSYPSKSVTQMKRKQPFKVITTRRYHAGLHQLSIIINGVEGPRLDFQVNF